MAQGNLVILAAQIGDFVNQILQRQTQAVLSGISSRGIYLQPPGDWTLFISWERFHGPLTINIAGKPDPLNIIQPGSEARLNLREIIFPGDKIQIYLGEANIWHSPPPPIKTDINTRQVEIIIQDALRLAKENPYLSLLEGILPGNQIPLPEIAGFDACLDPFLDRLEEKNLDQALNHLSGLIGLGPGLTPLGDDFLLGVILTLNRWQYSLFPEHNIEKLNQSLLKSISEKTTTLSASLLACGAEGIADERLIRVLDSFFGEDDLKPGIVEELLSWGSSSGIAVLAGMIAVVTRLPR
ncbi:MAG: DUF2877 domain-containing protein [Anaerolineales bacterium]